MRDLTMRTVNATDAPGSGSRLASVTLCAITFTLSALGRELSDTTVGASSFVSVRVRSSVAISAGGGSCSGLSDKLASFARRTGASSTGCVLSGAAWLTSGIRGGTHLCRGFTCSACVAAESLEAILTGLAVFASASARFTVPSSNARLARICTLLVCVFWTVVTGVGAENFPKGATQATRLVRIGYEVQFTTL